MPKLLYLFILLSLSVNALSQPSLTDIEFVINDYYTSQIHIIGSNNHSCMLFHIANDSISKYMIFDVFQPYPLIPPDTFFLINSCIVFYFNKYPPDKEKNLRILDEYKEYYFNEYGTDISKYDVNVFYDPPQFAYYFDKDGFLWKTEKDNQVGFLFNYLLSIYENP